MVLSRGLGTMRRRVLLSSAHCSQLELRLHTVISHRKAKRSWSPRAWGDQLSSDMLAETSMMLQRAPLCPCGMDPFPGVDYEGSVFEEVGGGGHQHPSLENRGVCSQQPVNWKHWSQPTSSGRPGFSPRR